MTKEEIEQIRSYIESGILNGMEGEEVNLPDGSRMESLGWDQFKVQDVNGTVTTVTVQIVITQIP